MVQLLFRFHVQSLSVGKYYTTNQSPPRHRGLKTTTKQNPQIQEILIMATTNQSLRSTREVRLQVAIATSRPHRSLQQELLVGMATTHMVLPKMTQQVALPTKVTTATEVQTRKPVGFMQSCCFVVVGIICFVFDFNCL